MSQVYVAPATGTHQNTGDIQYFFGWHIKVGINPIQILQCHTDPVYVTPPTAFQIFDHEPTDYFDQSYLTSDLYWEDDSENWFADVNGGAGIILQPLTDYWLLNRDDGAMTGCDYTFWTFQLFPEIDYVFPLATNNGSPFTIIAPVINGNDVNPPSSFPFPGALSEVLIENAPVIAVAASTSRLLTHVGT